MTTKTLRTILLIVIILQSVGIGLLIPVARARPVLWMGVGLATATWAILATLYFSLKNLR